MLRGALLGAAAGLGAVLLNDHERDESMVDGHEGFHALLPASDTVLRKALKVNLFTLGGLIAGRIMQGPGKKKKKK